MGTHNILISCVGSTDTIIKCANKAVAALQDANCTINSATVQHESDPDALDILNGKATRPLYQQRVIDEKADLDVKIAKLDAFIGSATFDALPLEERERLEDQFDPMSEYATILGERIDAFEVQ
jgi:hypothetical protein